MENKRTINIIFLIIVLILGTTLYKEFDFDTMRFENTGLAIIYIAVFVFSLFFLIKDFAKRPDNKN